MTKKITLLIFVFLIFLSSNFSQESNQNIYSGGMLIVQPGLIFTENNHQKIENNSLGLGGILRFYFKNNLTTGIFGGTQKTKYSTTMSENSYLSLGYGGPFLGYSFKVKKMRYTASAFVGRGTIKNLHIENQNNSILNEAYFYKIPTFVFSPILSIDYELSQRLHLSLQAVCLYSKFDNNKTLYNPTLQFGVLFNR